jgi:hypothetical protein
MRYRRVVSDWAPQSLQAGDCANPHKYRTAFVGNDPTIAWRNRRFRAVYLSRAISLEIAGPGGQGAEQPPGCLGQVLLLTQRPCHLSSYLSLF